MAKSNTDHPPDGTCTASAPGWTCYEDATPRTAYCKYHRQQQWQSQGFTEKVPRVRDVTVRNASGLKQCVKCFEWAPETGFYRCKTTRDNLQPHCKECTKWSQVWLRFKITCDEYWAKYEEQGGVCKICGEPSPNKRLGVDHDHSCCPGNRTCGGCVRGLLCESCNTGLGKFRDGEDILNRAINYLKENR